MCCCLGGCPLEMGVCCCLYVCVCVLMDKSGCGVWLKMGVFCLGCESFSCLLLCTVLVCLKSGYMLWWWCSYLLPVVSGDESVVVWMSSWT